MKTAGKNFRKLYKGKLERLVNSCNVTVCGLILGSGSESAIFVFQQVIQWWGKSAIPTTALLARE